MLKRIRDFIYDINDIFVAIVILLIAAGIIIWRSSAIMAYPEYLASKNPQTNTSNVDFSGIDLTPEKVENITENIEIIDPEQNQGGETTPDPDEGEQNQGGETTPDPNGGEQNQGGGTTPDPNGGEQNQGGAQTGTVTATITVDPTGEKWKNVVSKMIAAGLMTEEERQPFMDKLAELGFDRYLQPGTYTITNTSYEEMIRIICHKN